MSLGDWGLEESSHEIPADEIDRWVEPAAPALWLLLPAIWPPEHRRWVPSTQPELITEHFQRGDEIVAQVTRPLSDDEAREVEEDRNRDFAAAGLTPRPPGRRWYLRLPPTIPSLDALLEDLADAAERNGIEPDLSPEFVMAIQRRARELFT